MNPVTGLPQCGATGRTVNRGTFDETEPRSVLKAAPERTRLLFTLLAYTGTRPGEACALRGQDVSLVRELQALQERSGGTGEHLVFGTRSGQPLNGSNVLNRCWYPTLAKAGVRRLDLYRLRHTFASLARNADVAGFLVTRAMGHATFGLVDQVYADALPSGMAAPGRTGRRASTRHKARVACAFRWKGAGR